MNPDRVRTVALVAAGVLLFVQFLLQQVAEGLQASGIVLLAASLVLLGLAIGRIRGSPPETARTELGISEFALLVLVAVLSLITVGVGVLTLYSGQL